MLKLVLAIMIVSNTLTPFKYEPMKNGDKIKWVYLKDNPLGLDGLGFKLFRPKRNSRLYSKIH